MHTSEQGSHLGFVYLTGDDSGCYSAKLLKYLYLLLRIITQLYKKSLIAISVL